MEAEGTWPRRIAGLLALINAAYVILVVGSVALGVSALARSAGDEPWLALGLMALVIPLLIGLAIASPLLTWLIVLGINLWRGRRWARTAGLFTFAVCGIGLLVAAISGGVDGPSKVVFGILAAGPSLAGLAVLLTGARAFDAGSVPASADHAATT